MQAMRWTLPVARWSFAVAGAAEVGFIEPMVRRRLSSLSRSALKVAHDCLPAQTEASTDAGIRVVFASRHGELKRTTDILHAITENESVSPTAFSLSVLNAMTGVLGISRGERAPASALSAGEQTLGLALLEAHAQLATAPSSPVLVVYADEPADPIYGAGHDAASGALAILLDDRAAQHIECTRTHEAAPSPSAASFATQAEALRHCLESKTAAQWRAPSASTSDVWQWSWHAGSR
ncbi:beta-ketoacyl synthase chain length factor [Caballeronia telluris]|nr:beta-ketoacyl synthase chain length factor [Caballeronia telluris]